jgi:hypothetical protein
MWKALFKKYKFQVRILVIIFITCTFVKKNKYAVNKFCTYIKFLGMYTRQFG